MNTLKMILMSFLLMSLVLASSAFAEEQVIFEGESPYTTIQVYDKDDGLRYMQFGDYEQTIMNVQNPSYLEYDYIRSIMASFAFAEKPVEKVLLLGLGGGSMAHFITSRFPDVELDIFEIDPLVVELAEKFFKFQPGEHGNVHIGDGRRLLRNESSKYDLIILDAYKAGGIPFHLTTREFLESVRDHLNRGGVAVFHLWAEYANKYLQAQVKTIAHVFPRNYSFYDGAGSFNIFATRHDRWLGKDEVVRKGKVIGRKHKFHFDLGRLIEEQYTPASPIPTRGLVGDILTDDYAPVNLLRHQSGR